MIRLPKPRSRRRVNRNFIQDLLHKHGDALLMFVIISCLAWLTVILTPSDSERDLIPDNWYDYLETSPDSTYPSEPIERTFKEIELDLPFIQETADGKINASSATVATLWQTYTIKRHDTLGAILHRITNDKDAISYLVTQKLNSYRKLRRGQPIEYQLTDDGKLIALRYKASPDLHMRFTQDAQGNLQVSEEAPQLSSEVRVLNARVTQTNNSLFAAADASNVPDAVIQSLISALETLIDFQRDTRLDDRFTVIYEHLTDEDGDAAGSGRLLALRYINASKNYTGLLNDATGGYYNQSGVSLQRAFLRSPLKFTRISSRYTNRRYHPILKKWRSHRGVDFAAPTNTPVRSSADGVIDFAGKKGGYGNVVMIKHFNGYLTVYGHLNKFAKIKRGTRVTQGQLIGYVGSTGLATGPHLHYEFRKNGKFKNPLSTAVPTNKPPLTGDLLAQFQSSSGKYLVMLDAIGGTGNES